MAQAMTQSAARVVPEFAPERIDVNDVAAIRASLDLVHGYAWACIKEVASEAELQTARDMLWEHLEGRSEPNMRQTRPVGWKRGVPTTWLEGHGDGLLTSGTHAPAMWFVRSLPGVVRAFEAAYGEPAVAAYDRMSVNLPVTSGNPAALRVAETGYSHGKLNAMGLHTHYNQDGYGDDQLICYAIFRYSDARNLSGIGGDLTATKYLVIINTHSPGIITNVRGFYRSPLPRDIKHGHSNEPDEHPVANRHLKLRSVFEITRPKVASAVATRELASLVCVDPLPFAVESDRPCCLTVCDSQTLVRSERCAVHRSGGGHGRAVRAAWLTACFAAVKVSTAIRRRASVVALDVASWNFVRASFVIKNASLWTRATRSCVGVAYGRHTTIVDETPLRIATICSKHGATASFQ